MSSISEGTRASVMPDHGRFVLRLYISGPTTISTRALVNIRTLCEKHLMGKYELEVIDLSTDPRKAQEDQIISLPTLIKLAPSPIRRFIGDMSNTDRILTSLGMDPITIAN